jgi:hypothetical protein
MCVFGCEEHLPRAELMMKYWSVTGCVWSGPLYNNGKGITDVWARFGFWFQNLITIPNSMFTQYRATVLMNINFLELNDLPRIR